MRANPGGQLAPNEVIGRDSKIKEIWRLLKSQSVLLTAERRMGKTQMVKKMFRESPPGILPVFRDIEGIRSRIEFVEVLFRDIEAHLSRWDRNCARVRRLVESLGGLEVGGLCLPPKAKPLWKELLREAVADLMENQAVADRVVFFWDELPLMLLNIRQSEGGEAVAELLDVLREARQMHDGLRMVFTGSIGLHHVVEGLGREGYPNDPTNDMKPVDLPPLAPDDGTRLAERLLIGEGLPAPPGFGKALSAAVDHVPFYIHHVVCDLRSRGLPVVDEVLERVVTGRLTDPQDEWHLDHYRRRLRHYYGPEGLPVVLAILDCAAAEAGCDFNRLLEAVKAQVELPEAEAEKVRDLLRLLQRDHYLESAPGPTFRFRLPLVARWWRLQRGGAA